MNVLGVGVAESMVESNDAFARIVRVVSVSLDMMIWGLWIWWEGI